MVGRLAAHAATALSCTEPVGLGRAGVDRWRKKQASVQCRQLSRADPGARSHDATRSGQQHEENDMQKHVGKAAAKLVNAPLSVTVRP